MRGRAGVALASVLAWALAASAPAVALRFGPPRQLGTDVEITPAVAVGAGGRVAVLWYGGTAGATVLARIGQARTGLGPPGTLATDGEPTPNGLGGLAAAVGPHGTAAVAWLASGCGAGPCLEVAVAPPGRPFGAGQQVNGRDPTLGIDGIGVDRRGRVVVAWAEAAGGADYTRGRVRYAVGGAADRFTAPRTFPHGRAGLGDGQVLQTAAGGVVVTSAARPVTFAALAPRRRVLVALRRPHLPAQAAVGAVAAGPGGLGSALYTPDAPATDQQSVGTVAQGPGRRWRTPAFTGVPGVLEAGPAAAFPAGGGSVLAWGSVPAGPRGALIDARLEVSVAGPDGRFAGVQSLGPVAELPPAESYASPQLAAVGAGVAVAWLTPASDLRAAVSPAGGRFTAPSDLGALDPSTFPALASGGRRAALAWASGNDLWVAFAG